MYTVKKFSSPLGLTKFLRGELISSGTLTTAMAGVTPLPDTAGTPATDGVVVGDIVYVSGDSSERTVASGITDGTGVTLSGTVTADIGAAYRICRGKIASTDIINISYENNSANWVLIYESDPSF